MQRNAVTDVRVLMIAGLRVRDLTKVSETGYEDAPIEVPENDGVTSLIGSGQKKLKQIDLTFFVRRNSETEKFFDDWEKDGSFGKDVVIYETDKSGDILHATRRVSYGDCELGTRTKPEFDQASRTFAQFTVSLYPYRMNAARPLG